MSPYDPQVMPPPSTTPTRGSARSLRRRLVDALPAKMAIPIGARFGHRDPEIGLLPRFIDAGDTVVDVGAHKGAYTWHLARLVGTSGLVHAFEPQPELAHRLEVGLSHNVRVRACGLSDIDQAATLTVPIWGHHEMLGHATLEPVDPNTRHQSMRVDLVTMDSLAIRPTFIKVDVEGHESSVLEGGEHTIDAARPTLLLEIDWRHPQHEHQRAGLLDWLGRHGYRAYFADGDGLTRVGKLTPDTDPNGSIEAPTYIYNWFMIPE